MKRGVILLNAVVIALVALAGACASDLPKATEIERMRVLGTQISVIGDETRATPKPGERVRLTFVTAFPDLDSTTEESQMMIVSCTAPDRFTGGLPICQELIDAAESAAQTGDIDSGSLLTAARKIECSDIPGRRQTFAGVTVACVNGPPAIDLTIPAGFSAPSSMFLGVICERGKAYFDPTSTTLFGCDDNDGETIGLHGVYPVQQHVEDENHNPDITKLSIEMEAFIEWRPLEGTRFDPAGDMPVELPRDCIEATTDLDNDGNTNNDPDDMVAKRQLLRTNPFLPGTEVGAHQLILRYPAEERERILGEPGQPFESLEITVHATFGEMERQFTVFTNDSETYGAKRGDVPIDTDPPWLEEDVSWDPDDKVPTSGQLVRFFVTARDQRGGFNMSTYAACVR